jgi:hypothetical protein
MKRILLDLDEQNLAHLNEIAKSQNSSRAHVLREAVRDYIIRKDQCLKLQPKPLYGFGLLKGRLPDGLTYQDDLRGEWS